MGFVIHWHESAMDLHVFPIPIPPPTSLYTRSLWVFPVHQVRTLVSCIQSGLVICFTIDNIHVFMLFFRYIPPSPSPTESKSLFFTSVSLLYNTEAKWQRYLRELKEVKKLQCLMLRMWAPWFLFTFLLRPVGARFPGLTFSTQQGICFGQQMGQSQPSRDPNVTIPVWE